MSQLCITKLQNGRLDPASAFRKPKAFYNNVINPICTKEDPNTKPSSKLTLHGYLIPSWWFSLWTLKWSGSFYKTTNFIVDYTLVRSSFLLRILRSVCLETCYLVLCQVQRNFFKIRLTAVSLHLPQYKITSFSAQRVPNS